MKNIHIYLFYLFLSSCGSASQAQDPSWLEQARPFYDQACSSFKPSSVPRCDRATFVAWMSVICKKDFGIFKYQDLNKPGLFHRDVKPCFPDHSRSECSLDTYLPILYFAHITKNKKILRSIHDYGGKRNWIMCEGDTSATNITPLVPMIYRLLNKSGDYSIKSWDITNPFEGFRGHLLAGYAWLSASISKDLIDDMIFRQVHKEIPDSPYINALYQRYVGNGDHAGTIHRLHRVTDELSQFSWGSSPAALHKSAAYAVMEGR